MLPINDAYAWKDIYLQKKKKKVTTVQVILNKSVGGNEVS